MAKSTSIDQREDRSPFDVSGPSLFGAALEKSHRISKQTSRLNASCPERFKFWILEKADPNVKFTMINASQFGTRQRKVSK